MIFRERILAVPQPDRDALLRETRVILDNQVAWIDGQFKAGGTGKAKGSS